MNKIRLTLCLILFCSIFSFAQVTTSSLGGYVTDKTAGLEGAVVTAVHAPSGTEYYSVADKSGYFRISNMKVGGPYVVTAQLLGYSQAKASDIFLRLGETYVQDFVLEDESLSLDALVFVSTADDSVMSSDLSGTSVHFGGRTLANTPTVKRTLEDVVRMTPQANGMSFGGRDPRFNNFSVDGAGFNNNFGLDSSLPGGEYGPISFEALEEISVNLAPYDVRLSRFTGASINAVTKSGTNEFDGTAYTYQKFKGMTGTRVGDVEIPGAGDLSSQTYGLSLGGPIVKNKLFFYLNAEYSPSKDSGPGWVPSVDGIADPKSGISRTTVGDLETVRNHLIDTYQYDPGDYGKNGWAAFNNYTYKILARIDWNIGRNHRLMLRYNDVKNSTMSLPSGNSCPPGLKRDKSVTRVGPESIAFSKNFYREDFKVRSIAGELNSRFSDRVSNNLIVTYNMTAKERDPQSELFPHVDIFKDGKQYISLGLELFSYNNAVIDNTAAVTDNLIISLDNHTLTIGASFEHIYVKNSYIREGSSYYRYASIDDFIKDRLPIGMGITYGYNGEEAPGVQLNYAQTSAYIQDEWQAGKNLRVTGGVRFELPVCLDKDLMKSNAIYSIAQANGFAGGPWDSSTWPKAYVSVNPRIGFNWDVKGDRTLQLRGGTGIFSGINPFVWFTGQSTSAAFVQSPEISISDFSSYPGLHFMKDYRDLLKAYPDMFPTSPDQDNLASGSGICMVDKDFKFPQIWRSNLAVDVSLPWNMVFTAEALFSRDIFGVKHMNLNEPAPIGNMYGADSRPVWDFNDAVNRIDKIPVVTKDVSSAMLLTNAATKGYSAQFTAQLTKNFSKGLSGSIAYTYSNVKDLSSNLSSSVYSSWSSNSSCGSLNDELLGWSANAVPHRVIANLSYRFEYARNFATTFSLFYQGSHNGRISYIYGGDVNGDGLALDLMYIPRDESEITFTDLTYTDKETGNQTFIASAEDQSRAFFDYIDSNPYLKSRKGQYVERFGGLTQWLNMFDVKIVQDIFTGFGTDDRYTLQLSLDILNVGNLLNSNWGCYYASRSYTYNNQTLLNVASGGSTSAAPAFTLNVGDASKVSQNGGVEAFRSVTSWNRSPEVANCWSMLFGIRLMF
ncbi:MAG: TonB-dependent receptor [Bacteroidales bacterium]|nr:TonB-dependent receptor [Bacteroidales bacterium]